MTHQPNPANLNQAIIRHQPTSVTFGIYTDDEVRQRSVCEISSSVTFDALGIPLPRGLYDPMLGPTASEKGEQSTCPTCANVQSLCPGHFGHIELCIPLMHPLFFPKLLMFMKMKCLACHEFRLSKRQVRIFCAKLHLVDGGRMMEAQGLDAELASAAAGAGAGKLDEKPKGAGGAASDARQEMIATSAHAMDEVLDRKLALPSLGTPLTLHERSVRRNILKDFQAACTKTVKCANCHAFSPKIRHDQFNKLFQITLSARNKRSNMGERIRIRSAAKTVGGGSDMFGNEDESDEEEMVDSEDEVMDDVEEEESEEEEEQEEGNDLIDDEAMEDNSGNKKKSKKKKKKTSKADRLGDEDIDPTGGRISRKATVSTVKDSHAKADKMMNVIEIEAQCQLTWEKQPFLCCKFFGSAHAGPEADDYAVSVGGVGASLNYVSEDEEYANGNSGGNGAASSNALGAPKNKGYSLFFLRAIPVPPSRFRPPVMMGQMTIEHSQNYYLSKVLELNARLRSSFAATNEIGRQEREIKESGTDTHKLSKLKAEREKIQANSLTTWVDLQTTTNCFMDSSRDPQGTAANNAPAGIRQLLEKKEGIFRKHMMGKRVNFACRSVISPDPYIGTDEIGLPLSFAKVLTFPTPVTNFNITEMQTLVRRGADEYPGAVWVEFPNGSRVDLIKMKENGRNAIAARLLSTGSGG
eukprot:CAMPEP_0201948180 /NCGR_PEP_ID=MMETSP0903-20130614/55328_1 /ASSEMBLY_ACC=CAM_ASM_000552 /TAXON_ID=420261 /ORGANISM="Thalassiosira antarctica, Strain CCMP982" /LENGTH=695 /DNA_ID=CAMNT_0048491353 /DNA_START=126 /DNA_END=2209 /DNA_ORIENTATION=-